jgi:hypothetical protein
MAPTKSTGITNMVTRMRSAAHTVKAVAENSNPANKNKRKADTVLSSTNKKRSALGDLTNVSTFLSSIYYSMSTY